MIRSVRISVFLILLLLLASSVAAIHHHRDAIEDRDCTICAMACHQQAVSQTPTAFDEAPVFFERVALSAAPLLRESILTSFASNRAPPV